MKRRCLRIPLLHAEQEARPRRDLPVELDVARLAQLQVPSRAVSHLRRMPADERSLEREVHPFTNDLVTSSFVIGFRSIARLRSRSNRVAHHGLTSAGTCVAEGTTPDRSPLSFFLVESGRGPGSQTSEVFMSSKSWLAIVALTGMAASASSCGVEKPVGEDSVGVAQSALSPAGNLHGIAETVHSTGTIDRTNPFFQALGANPRTCESCHAANQGWTITTLGTQTTFLTSLGLAPIFLPHDAGSRPDEDLSTFSARFTAFSKTLLNKGLIRFGRTVPGTAEFTVTAVVDPYGFATPTQITNFRRPTPVSNESKTSTVTWTGGPHDVPTAVNSTAIGATTFHEQRATPLPADQAAAIRDFQLGLAFAQISDWDAGRLDADGALGGPTNLLAQAFSVGANDIQSPGFTRNVFTIFDAWKVYADAHAHHVGDGCEQDLESFVFDVHGRQLASRAAIYRGQELFNNLEFSVSKVHGLNDVLGPDLATPVTATCSTCHNAPNVGGHAVFRMFDVGTADADNCSADLPLLTLQNKGSGAERKVCDMGKGGNGVWADVGSFRAPPLRGLAARAPYFHDGQATSLTAVVSYFDKRFNIGLTRHQKRDLEAFLGAL